MLAIKSNLMADNAARHLGSSYDALAKSVERLSSGLRINSAKDDAAGLAVSELVRADVAVLKQGGRNASDAISMLQTAEGAMGVQDDLLVRMKELAEQAATDSYSDTQRGIMNQEFQQLSTELTRVAQSTKFNNIALLDSNSTYSIHVGSDETIDIQAQKVTAEGLGLGNTGSKDGITLNVGTANTNQSGFITADGTFTVKFGGEAQISASLTDGMSMNEVAQAINAASQTAGGYNAASIEYDSNTGIYSLKVSAKDNGVAAATVGGTSTQLGDIANFAETAGADGSAVDISTKDGATAALTALTSAINTKDTYRAKLGYMMNRLDSAVNVVNIQAENLSAAQSRITDVDTATETAALTRNQVLAQAGVSMLAQANQMPQMATKLLG